MFVYQVIYVSEPEDFYPKAKPISGIIEIKSERRIEKMRSPENYLADLVLSRRPELNQVEIVQYRFLGEEEK